MPVVKPEPAWRPSDGPKAPLGANSCNLHVDCEAADRAVASTGGRIVQTYYGPKVLFTAVHCDDASCEDCFGC